MKPEMQKFSPFENLAILRDPKFAPWSNRCGVLSSADPAKLTPFGKCLRLPTTDVRLSLSKFR